MTMKIGFTSTHCNKETHLWEYENMQHFHEWFEIQQYLDTTNTQRHEQNRTATSVFGLKHLLTYGDTLIESKPCSWAIVYQWCTKINITDQRVSLNASTHSNVFYMTHLLWPVLLHFLNINPRWLFCIIHLNKNQS